MIITEQETSLLLEEYLKEFKELKKEEITFEIFLMCKLAAKLDYLAARPSGSASLVVI